MIKEFEFYHGVVFSKLIHNPNCKITSIKLYNHRSNSSYILNNNVGIYIKYSTKRLTPWRFSFQKIHQGEILELQNAFPKVYILLVCGEDGIVTLSFEE